MKSTLYFFCLSIAMFMLSCTSSRKATEATTALFANKWFLQTINDKEVTPGAYEIPFIAFSKGDETRVSGNSSCNLFNGTVTLGKNQSLQFSPLASTRKACMGDNIEQEFLNTLQKADRFQIADGQLSLLQGTDVLATFGVSGDTLTGDPIPEALSGEWQLNFITGKRIAFEGLYPHDKPVIAFDTDKPGQVGGNTSCNSFQSNIQINDDRIKISEPVAMTMRACEGEGESSFLNALKEVNHYKVAENNLHLYKDDVVLMSFDRK